MLLDILKVIIISVVEGLTEFIPVSSTGHILIVEALLKPFSNEEFRNAFTFVIQLGAIMSVVLVYWKRIFPFIGTKEEQKEKYKEIYKLINEDLPTYPIYERCDLICYNTRVQNIEQSSYVKWYQQDKIVNIEVE